MPSSASILVVDDDAANCLAVGAALAPLGERVVTAQSGAAALQQLLADEFAVVLLDVSMPAMDGFETAALIRGREKTRGLPIIFLTGIVTEPAEMLRGYAQGAVDYLIKPYDVEVLRAKVRVFIELHHAREELRRLSVEEARAAQAESERARLFALLRDAPVAIGELRGREHRFAFVNPRIERMLNRTELTGKTVVEALPFVAGTPLIDILDGVFERGQGFAISEFATPFDRHGDGKLEEAFFSFNIEPLRDPVSGAVTGMMGVAVEVTDQVLARRRVEEAVRARDEFLSIASHELRTPLSTLRLQTASLLRAAGDGFAGIDPAAKLTMMHQQLDRLERLITDLVEVTRISSGRLELKHEPLDLGDLVHEIAGRFADEIAAAGCTARLRLEPGVAGKWDYFRIDQVVTNAMKYGKGAPIELAVRLSDDGRAELAVRDGGVGIAPEEQARIFDRFERASSGRSFGGLGLGLWIVSKIVAAHGGTIAVKSALGQGATFTVRLPLG
ncbi:MAG TPA: ATP-binding protein [Polyangia bacterium]